MSEQKSKTIGEMLGMEDGHKKIEFPLGSGIDECVELLLSYKTQGRLACGDFNGHMLYSDSVTLDSAYILITGKTKEQNEEDRLKEKAAAELRKKKHQNQMPDLIQEWVTKGREVLSEDKLELWDRIVPIRLRDLYQGMELGACLEIVKVLNEGGTLEEAKAVHDDQGHSGLSYGLVGHMVRAFADRGEEYTWD